MAERGDRKYRHAKGGGVILHLLNGTYDLRLSTSSIEHEIENALRLHSVGSGGD